MNKTSPKNIRQLGAICLLVLASVSLPACAQSVADKYADLCAGCHGDALQGASGPSLKDDVWLYGNTGEAIANSIRNGIAPEMPAFDKALTDAELRGLVIFIQESVFYNTTAKQTVKVTDTFAGADATFTLQPVLTGMGDLWGMDEWPGGGLIFTDKRGDLYVFDGKQKRGPIEGVPAVKYQKQAGLMDVKLHPEFDINGWVYLSFVDENDNGLLTAVVRGKIDKGKWVSQQDIYRGPKDHYTPPNGHFGSRLVFHDGYLYFGIGDRRNQDGAQSLTTPNGKIHRLHDDGRVPKDNPFVKTPGAVPSIFSYGHRNPQGLTLNPLTKDVWDAEHGPRGGDEINQVQKGLNYGWPVISFGMNYNGTPMVESTHKQGMEQPIHYWVPSIAVSSIDFYQGKHFPQWQNKLLVASLKKEQLHVLTVDKNRVVKDEIVLKGLGRIRDVHVGESGVPYIILNGDPKVGGIYKLVPVSDPKRK